MTEPTIPPNRFHDGVPSAMLAAAREYIAAAEWTFAKTMPTNPHWYAVRQSSRAQGIGPGHEALYVLIRDFHYDRWWGGRTWRSIDLDGFGYWIVDDGMIINRKPIAEAGWRD